MQWSDIQFRPPDRLLRQFAGLWIGFFIGVALWLKFQRAAPPLLVGICLLVAAAGLLGLFKPQAMRPIFVGWTVLVFPIGWLISKTILGLIFYGVFTPIALFFRLRGRDYLEMRRAVKKETYWTEKPAPRDVGQYLNQS